MRDRNTKGKGKSRIFLGGSDISLVIFMLKTKNLVERK